MSLTFVYQLAVYYGTLVAFAVAGLVLNAGCLLIVWLPHTASNERFFQRVIHHHFAALVRWLDLTGLVALRYQGFDRLPPGGFVLVANHPGLLDIIFLIARLPEAVCVFKPAIRFNPVLFLAAARAGYLASDGGVDLVRRASKKVSEGQVLIVFPEGTRTPEGGLHSSLKTGFALIARRASVPVQLVQIQSDGRFLSKRGAWWRVPKLPVRISVNVGPCLANDGAKDTARVIAEVEQWIGLPPTNRRRQRARTPARNYSPSRTTPAS